ncbi:hypothetical protein [Roseobacter sinensis]|uniref:DUF4177 domain-containing protein n=1 Tax=Roseobacter sinensis TaxID=2931391 RepID=A0ABT3BAE3_9RHOB|nr:hypothetical protein [Roseobacter sp. WL0113]MCV3270179.1 hypothetical protein [Roseobacter sp. WL0113]
MKQTALILGLIFALALPHGADAAGCYADYKAKQDNPLRLHYGVAEISQCSMGAAKTELAARLAARGWTLLNIVSVFDESGLEERKQSAGANFLRF